MTQIGYLAHDLSDPAIARRARMLHVGGARLRMSGFLRGDGSLPDDFDTPPLVLGQTEDARLAARAVAVGRTVAILSKELTEHMNGSSVLLARNLEMLVIAARLKQRLASKGRSPRLVYECLDLHRLLTASSPAGHALRRVQRFALKSTDLVVTSSPAFIENHLGAAFGGPILLVENKVLLPAGTVATRAPPTTAGPPWRIGWFGALRCRKSFETLARIARRGEGRVEVILRGRPARDIFPDLERDIANEPNMRFMGAYDAACDLPTIYGEVHFSWCIDYFEQGANSAWLLPNRLYESAFHRTIPIALDSVETGAFLKRQGCGVIVPDAPEEHMTRFFKNLDCNRYQAELAAVARQPAGRWSADSADCSALVQALAGRSAAMADASGPRVIAAGM